MMEVIITNALISIAIMGEIMYMFTCGQDYIKANIKRARRLFWIDRFVFICIGIKRRTIRVSPSSRHTFTRKRTLSSNI